MDGRWGIDWALVRMANIRIVGREHVMGGVRQFVELRGDLGYSFGVDFDPLFIGVEDFCSISEFGFFKPGVFFSCVTFPPNKVRLVIRGTTIF